MIIITIPNLMHTTNNIYYKNNDIWMPKKNPFCGHLDMKHDLNGLYVLISDDFYYFGKKAIIFP